MLQSRLRFAAYTAFVYLTTILFTASLGVSPDVAFGGALGIFALAKK